MTAHTFTVKDCYRIFNAPIYDLVKDDSNRSEVSYPLRTEKEFGELTAKQKRAFQRLKAGFMKAKIKGLMLRFFTLTTAEGVDLDINKSWDRFKIRVERASRQRKPNKRNPIIDTFEGFKLNNYCKLKTAEGNGVLHIVYAGTWRHYIPQAWISETWAQIHGGSKVVDIRLVKSEKLASYLAGGYLCKQPIIRMAYGWKWLYRGYSKSWKAILEHTGYRLSSALAYLRFNLQNVELRTHVYRDLDIPPPKRQGKRIFEIRYEDTLSALADKLLREKRQNIYTIQPTLL